MTLAGILANGGTAGARRLILVSLALNLFFIGVAGALIVRHYVPAGAVSAPIDRSAAGRIERLAAILSPADADALRDEFSARAPAVEQLLASYRGAREHIRQTLRAEPFDVEAMRAAMNDARGKRQAFDQALQELIASAAARMSSEGRRKLADGPRRGGAAGR